MALKPLALLKRMAKSYEHQAAQMKVALEVQAQANLPEVDLDPDRMAQVFGNLISNSLRYTREGGRILLAAGQENDRLVFSVLTGQRKRCEAVKSCDGANRASHLRCEPGLEKAVRGRGGGGRGDAGGVAEAGAGAGGKTARDV